ncbi:MAG: hypothetical protein AAF108_01280 [Planctomycetota bacterium]
MNKIYVGLFGLLSAAGSNAQALISFSAVMESGATASWSVSGENLLLKGNSYAWSLDGGTDNPQNWVEVFDSAGELAFTIRNASVSVNSPSLDGEGLQKSATPGSASLVTTFDIFAGFQNSTIVVDSPVVSFDTLTNAAGRAEASVTLTPAGTPATISPIDGGIYSADVNGSADSGTNFTTLLPEGTTAQFTGIDLADLSSSEFTPIADSVSSISSQFRFGVTAGALATGTGTFEIIPSPATISLLAVSGLVAARRRG